jgi:hypothetical protein
LARKIHRHQEKDLEAVGTRNHPNVDNGIGFVSYDPDCMRCEASRKIALPIAHGAENRIWWPVLCKAISAMAQKRNGSTH